MEEPLFNGFTIIGITVFSGFIGGLIGTFVVNIIGEITDKIKKKRDKQK